MTQKKTNLKKHSSKIEKSSIPKVLHYVWLGKKPLTEEIKNFIKTWKKHCPDYKIIEWNESNINLNNNLFFKQAYESKKFAYASDVARLQILYEHGGIYLDTDVEVLKPFDNLLNHFAFAGFESKSLIQTSILACNKKNPWIKMCLDYYKTRPFILPNGKLDVIPNTMIVTALSKLNYSFSQNNKFQDLKDIVVYPREYFSPKDIVSHKINTTNNTYIIHHFAASWFNKWQKLRSKIFRFLQIIVGRKIFDKLEVFGVNHEVKKIIKRIKKEK